jgi:hypothetical protein
LIKSGGISVIKVSASSFIKNVFYNNWVNIIGKNIDKNFGGGKSYIWGIVRGGLKGVMFIISDTDSLG